MACMQAVKDSLQKMNAYMETSVRPQGFSVTPVPSQQAHDEESANTG